VIGRGEIWTVAGAGYASKPRPALIVQDDRYRLESLTVLLLTSTLLDAPLFRVRVPADEQTGLARDSDVMVDKIMTVRRDNVREQVGEVTSATMIAVERRLMAFLGVA